MKIGVTSPLYVNNNNHRDFVNKATSSIATSHKFVWIPVENYIAPQYKPYNYVFTQHPDETYVIEGRQPQSVARGWNDGISKAFEVDCDYCLVINDDIVMRTDAIDRLVAFAQQNPDFAIWSMGQLSDLFTLNDVEINDESWSEHPCFSAFMVAPKFFSLVGTFDENIEPAYFEDNCCHARLVLSGYKAVVYGGSRFFHFGSATVNSDADYKSEMPPKFVRNSQYFLQKFGRTPLGEADEMRGMYYKHPYNIEGLTWDKPIPDFWNFLARHGVDDIKKVDKQEVLDYVASRNSL